MEFLYANVLWLMLLPSIILIYLISTNKTNLQVIFNKEILDKLSAKDSGLNMTTRNTLMFFSLILMILALSRPVILQKEQEIKQNLIPVIIALDVSKSMQSTDIYPNRLELAKNKIKEFLNTSQNSAVGIVFFAKSTFILSPITKDFTTLLYMLDNLDNRSLNFDNGSNVMALLESSNELLQEYESKNIIILSDGGNNIDFEKEIEFTKEQNIKIYVLATATKQGAPIPSQNGYLTDNKGNIVTVSLNENIKELALNSGGGYINFSIDHNDIKAINSELLDRSEKEQLDIKKVKVYTELFYYPLALAIFFLFISLFSIPKRQANTYILFLALFFISTPAYSGILDFQILKEAKKAYEEENYKYAANQYKKVDNTNEAHYNLGNSLYKQGKYKEAIKSYERIVTSDKEFEAQKLHNMGNSYVKLNDLNKAKQMYENALKKHFDKQTKENLDRINEAMNKKDDKKNHENQNDQQNKDQDKKNKDKNSQNQEQKNKENSKEQQEKNKEDRSETSQDQKSGESKKDQDKKEQSKDKTQEQKQQNQTSAQELINKEISDIEEKKWIERLKERKTNTLLLPSKTKNDGDDDSSTPW